MAVVQIKVCVAFGKCLGNNFVTFTVVFKCTELFLLRYIFQDCRSLLKFQEIVDLGRVKIIIKRKL